MTCGCGPVVQKCESKKGKKKCLPLPAKRCSKFITEAAERIALRRNANLCCPIEPCFTTYKPATRFPSKKMGKIVCKEKVKRPCDCDCDSDCDSDCDTDSDE